MTVKKSEIPIDAVARMRKYLGSVRQKNRSCEDRLALNLKNTREANQRLEHLGNVRQKNRACEDRLALNLKIARDANRRQEAQMEARIGATLEAILEARREQEARLARKRGRERKRLAAEREKLAERESRITPWRRPQKTPEAPEDRAARLKMNLECRQKESDARVKRIIGYQQERRAAR